MSNSYADPQYDGLDALQGAIDRNDVDKLGEAIAAAALYAPDFAPVHRACIQLSSHTDEIIRGNSILGFGHLARRFSKCDDDAVQIVGRGLRDPSEYVRGQAWAAADDLRFFVGADIDPDEASQTPTKSADSVKGPDRG